MAKLDSLTLTGITNYLNTPPLKRGTLIRSMLDSAGGFDYWMPIKQAATKDRNTTRDGAALTAAAANAREDRRTSFGVIARAWAETVVPRWATSTPVPITPTTVQIGSMEVRVRPQFADQRADGRVEVVLVYCNKTPLEDFALNGTLRVIERAYPDMIAVLVDLPRAAIHTSERKRLERLDPGLNAEVAGLRYLLSPGDAVA
ncbi:hypothetical protein [Oerskovia paurometabola]|uniref:hypothetical protein n=1 Tax=Oerskovia paurometabola TaxID=162170 RepID=UPI0037F336C0